MTVPADLTATIEVRNDYFRSLQNGTGGNAGFLNNYARDTIAVGGTVTWAAAKAQDEGGGGDRDQGEAQQRVGGAAMGFSGEWTVRYPVEASRRSSSRYQVPPTGHSCIALELGLPIRPRAKDSMCVDMSGF